MKKIVLSLILLLSFAYSQAQNRFPTTDSLQNYVLRYVKNSSVESFTNYRLQNILIGLSQMVDTLRQNGYVDSIWIGTGDTLKYRIGNSTLVIGKITGGGGGSYSFTYPLQLNTSTVSLDTTYIHSFPFYNTQYRPITWFPTLQEVTTAGNTTDANIELTDGAGLILTNSTVSFNKGSVSTQLDVIIPTQTNNILLPNNSGTVLLNTDTSSMLSPYLRSNVAAATYQPIGSYLTSVPTLQQVTDQGNKTNIKIVLPSIEFINLDEFSANLRLSSEGTTIYIEDSIGYSLSLTFPSTNNNFNFPETSGNIQVGVKVNGTTYMAGGNGIADIGSVGGVTTTTLTDSLNANGITGITLNTSGAIHTNPITFTRSGRTFTGSMSLATQSANRVFAGPTSGGAATPTFRALVDADIPSTSKGVQWAGVDSSFAASMASNGEHEVEEFKVVGSSLTSNTVLTGTKYAFVAGSGNAIGFWDNGVNGVRLGTLTSTSAAPYVHMGWSAGNSIQGYQLGTDWVVMTCRVRIPDLSDGTNTYHLRAGLVTALNSTPLSGGIVFTYDLSGTQTGSSATSNWQTITASSNTRTYSQNAQNTTSVSANTWTKLQIVASSSVVYFYINGTLVATHTSNLPTAQNLVPYFDIRKTAGATARTFEIDYNTIDIKYSTPR